MLPKTTKRISLKAATDQELDKAYLTTAGDMLRMVERVSNAPSGEMQLSLAALDEEAARLEEADEMMAVNNPQLEQTLKTYGGTMQTTQGLIASNADIIQASVIPIAIQAVTMKVFGGLSGKVVQSGGDVFSPAAAKYVNDSVSAAGIPWKKISPDAAMQAAGYVQSDAWKNRLNGWGDGYADMTEKTIIGGIRNGAGPTATAAQMRKIAQNIPLSSAENLTRTLQLTSYRDVSAAQEKINGGYIRGKIRIAKLDDKTCLACVSLHATEVPVGEPISDHYRGRCSSWLRVEGGPDFPDTMQADSTPGNRQFTKFQNGEDWFASLPPERQAAQLSMQKTPAKLRAYQDGTPLNKFVTEVDDDVFGRQVTEGSLKGVLGDGAEQYYKRNQVTSDAVSLYKTEGGNISTIPAVERQAYVENISSDMAKELDFVGKVLYSDLPPDSLGYLPDNAGAAFDIRSGDVHIFDAAFQDGAPIEGILAHEMTHPTLLNLNAEQTREVLEEIYKDTGLPLDELEFYFMKEDGFTKYAEYNWTTQLLEDNTFTNAVRETACEISRIDIGGAKISKEVTDVWRKAHTELLAEANREAARKVAEKAAFEAQSKTRMNDLFAEFGIERKK